MPPNAEDRPPWFAFTADWKGLDLSSLRSEQDVREEVLAPMLRMLGYGGQTVNAVLRAHPEPLPRSYRMVGSRRIEVDYVPTLRLQRFWIMEAKKPGALDRDAFLQAHFYATHPSIAARYIVLADGEQLRVYDSAATEFDDVRVVVYRDNADRDFAALYEILAAQNLKDSIRRDVLRDVERVLVADVDLEAPRSFESEIARIALRVRPAIAENARQLIVKKAKEDAERRQTYLRSVDVRTLLAVMAHPTEVGSDTANELARRLIEGGAADRRAAASAALAAVERPSRQTVRFGVMLAFLTAGAAHPESDDLGLFRSGVELARSNLSYAADRPAINATLHLENAVDRVSMKIIQDVMGEQAAEAERVALRTSSPEEIIINPPSRNIPLIMYAAGLAATMWTSFGAGEPEEVLGRVRAIERFEHDCLPELPPRLVGDQIMFAYKGREFDFLIRATVDGLARIATRAPGMLPEDLAVVGTGWDAGQFPPTPQIPDGEADVTVQIAFETMLDMLRKAANGSLQAPPETNAGPTGNPTCPEDAEA